jgi:hypothetical protein
MQDAEVRAPLERFAIPHQFQPQLTLFGAVLAIAAALTQILFGCLIAALWGVRIWLAAVSEHSMVWKSFAILGLAGAMAGSLMLLVYGVQAVIGRLSKKA